MPTITITELEAAINFWRQRIPSAGEEGRLCAHAGALARPYALLIFNAQEALADDQLDEAARTAWQAYRALSADPSGQ